MDLKRANPHLNEFVQMMDEVFFEAGGSVSLAWDRIGTTEKEFMKNEIRRSIQDPRYYLENYHTIRTEQDGLKTMSPFWDSQELFYEEVMKLFRKNGKVLAQVLKARQLGLSTICEGLIFWRTLFTPTCNALIVASDIDKVDHQFEMSRLAYDCLPWWMQPEVRYEQKGRVMVFDRRDELMRKMNPGLRSNIYVEAANKSTGVARGKTIRAAHLSELATWECGGETLTEQIFPSMNATDTMAFMESTAEGRNGFWYRWWKDTEDGKTDWHPIFIPFYKVRKYAAKIEKGEVFTPTADEEQFRAAVLKDDHFPITDEILKWRRKSIAQFVSLTGDEFGFMQEYPANSMEAFQGKGVCAFNKRLLHKMLSACVAPNYVGEINLELGSTIPKVQLRPVESGHVLHAPKTFDRFWVWEQPDPNAVYYVAADVAQGNEGGDFSVVEVLKIGAGMEPDEQVAEWRGWINPTTFAYICAAIGYMYNTAEVSIECNAVGQVTNNEIFRVIEYDQIYRWKHLDKIKNSQTNFVGWYTNYKTREALIAKMGESVNDRSITLRSKWLIDEMMDFSYDEDGGGKAQGQATKDDRVMAMMICRYCAHDSDFGKRAMARPMNSSSAGVSTWYILDPENRKVGEYHEHAAALAAFDQFRVKANFGPDRFKPREGMPILSGYSILQAPQAKCFANSLYSPIHDKAGLRSRMHYEMGYSAENIDHESVMYEQMAETPDLQDPNAWLNY